MYGRIGFRRRSQRKAASSLFRCLDREILEARYVLSAVTFVPHEVISSEVMGVNDVQAADLDNDGDLDVVSASKHDGKIAWYENLDGVGSFGTQHVVTSGNARSSVDTADVDGDGDLDLLSDGDWFVNLDGRGAFGLPQRIADNSVSTQAADFDGDGDQDVLSVEDLGDGASGIAWYENVDGLGTFGAQRRIAIGEHWPADQFPRQKVHAADVDGDGDSDVLISTDSWFENTDGQGNFAEPRAIAEDSEYVWVGATYPADVDGDNDLDLVVGFYFFAGWSTRVRRVGWYENVDGLGSTLR